MAVLPPAVRLINLSRHQLIAGKRRGFLHGRAAMYEEKDRTCRTRTRVTAATADGVVTVAPSGLWQFHSRGRRSISLSQIKEALPFLFLFLLGERGDMCVVCSVIFVDHLISGLVGRLFLHRGHILPPFDLFFSLAQLHWNWPHICMSCFTRWLYFVNLRDRLRY